MPGVTAAPMVLAASDWVTTEQESKLPVAAVVVAAAGALVVGDATDVLAVGETADVLAVGAGLDDLEEDVPHAASRTVAKQATVILVPPKPSLIRPLDRIMWKRVCRSLFQEASVLSMAKLKSQLGLTRTPTSGRVCNRRRQRRILRDFRRRRLSRRPVRTRCLRRHPASDVGRGPGRAGPARQPRLDPASGIHRHPHLWWCLGPGRRDQPPARSGARLRSSPATANLPTPPGHHLHEGSDTVLFTAQFGAPLPAGP